MFPLLRCYCMYGPRCCGFPQGLVPVPVISVVISQKIFLLLRNTAVISPLQLSTCENGPDPFPDQMCNPGFSFQIFLFCVMVSSVLLERVCLYCVMFYFCN